MQSVNMISEEQFLQQLVAVFPGFQQVWSSSGNLSLEDDGSFNYHGVCLEFTPFYKDHFSNFNRQQLSRLFQIVEHWIKIDPDDKLAISNALATCFLEDIVLTPLDHPSRVFMGPSTLRFMEQWDD